MPACMDLFLFINNMLQISSNMNDESYQSSMLNWKDINRQGKFRSLT
jgi:hypothetical protein